MDGRRFDALARAFAAARSRRALVRAVAGSAAGGLLAHDRLGAAARPMPEAIRQAAAPVTGHPRLWLTAEDLPRLRAWAVDSNPIYRDGLLVRAEESKAEMDAGTVTGEDPGGHDAGNTEAYAELFAFLSLITTDAAESEDYARRARELLMYVIDEAAKGPAEAEPFRSPWFSIQSRSRWMGEAFPLTVDWIYPHLSAEDKATIRAVFLRWCEENLRAEVTGYNHPEPVGVVNDPVLVEDPTRVRWAANNYYTAHMRNMGLMAMALDPEDDPGGELSAYLGNAIGAWLYVVDHLLRGDARGGLGPEGFEYGPQTLGYVAQFLLALHVAGQDDPDVWGPQVALFGDRFWDDLIAATVHSLSPAPVVDPEGWDLGPVHQPAWFGDGRIYLMPDLVQVLGPLGLYDARTGNTARLEAIRWIQTHLANGGPERLTERATGPDAFHDAILYFLLFDPEAPEPADPRPALPLTHFAPGIGRLRARTSWDADAAWFTYGLGWHRIDHQRADGNQFELYRNGEWLTKERTGYGENIGASDYHNTLALENDRPFHADEGDYRRFAWERGSQWFYDASGDPTILAMSLGPDYVYALGDATNLYNSEYESSTDILHASRSIVWLPPDRVVVYDRAASNTDGRFKRFWLSLPAEAVVEGNRTTMRTAGGQQLVVTTLLPTDAEIAVEPVEPLEEEAAPLDPIRYRLRVEAPGGPREARFLHVLQGADAGATPDEAVLVATEDGTFAGALVAGTLVLCPVDVTGEVAGLSYLAPAGTTRHLITGLIPGGGYDVAAEAADEGLAVTVSPGDAFTADDGGVLYWAPEGSAADADDDEPTPEPTPEEDVQATTVPEEEPTAEGEETEATEEAVPSPEDGGEGSVVVELEERDGSGVSGLAILEPAGDETVVTLLLLGAPADPLLLVHRSTCAALEMAPAFLLQPVDTTGRSETTLAVALAELQRGGYAIAVHAGADDPDTVLACGDLPAG